MSARVPIFLLVILALAPLTLAKNKKKQVLPGYVLKAQTVMVVIHPLAGEPLTNPTINRTAQDNVEKALMKWGRFRLVTDTHDADLVVAVRKGHAGGPTIMNSPTDNATVIYQTGRDPHADSRNGRSPDPYNPCIRTTADPGTCGPEDQGPRIGNEAGWSDDTFEVYQGGVEHPVDAAPVWIYTAKGALNEPHVTAVEHFRQAIDESEKQHQPKP
jgi:hypothetical protein